MLHCLLISCVRVVNGQDFSPEPEPCRQGLREKFFQEVRRSTPGPQNLVKHLQVNQKRSSLKFGPIFCPKFGEEQKKKFSLKFGPIFCPKLGEEQKEEKKLVQNLRRQPQLFRAPLDPGTMYPLNPPLGGPACRANYVT